MPDPIGWAVLIVGALVGSLTGKADSFERAQQVADMMKAAGSPFGNVVLSWSQDNTTGKNEKNNSVTFRIQNFWHMPKSLPKPPVRPVVPQPQSSQRRP